MARNRQSLIDIANDLAEERLGIDLDEAADQLRELGRGIQSRIEELDIDETTIPDAFQNVPKVISPKVHRWLDVGVTGYFLALGAWFLSRGKGGPATAALVNAGMVAGVSAMTDYEGKGEKPINFKMHGTLDALQATTAALGPVIHGFAGKPESAFFYGQAANEIAVIAATDWDAGMPAKSRRKKAA